MHLLKSNSIIKLSFSFSFTIRFAFISLFSLRAKNWLSSKIIILLVYIPIILNRVPVVIISVGILALLTCTNITVLRYICGIEVSS